MGDRVFNQFSSDFEPSILDRNFHAEITRARLGFCVSPRFDYLNHSGGFWLRRFSFECISFECVCGIDVKESRRDQSELHQAEGNRDASVEKNRDATTYTPTAPPYCDWQR
jgi:hypothetical protein